MELLKLTPPILFVTGVKHHTAMVNWRSTDSAAVTFRVYVNGEVNMVVRNIAASYHEKLLTLEPGTTNNCWLTAVDAEGVESDPSNVVIVETQPITEAPVDTPRMMNGVYNLGVARIDWLDLGCDDCEGFYIYRNGMQYADLPKWLTFQYTDSAVEVNQTYTYSVQAYNGIGVSSMSNEITVETAPTPEAFTIVGFTTHHFVDIGWTYDQGLTPTAIAFEIYRDGEIIGTEIMQDGLQSYAYVDAFQVPGSEHTFQVNVVDSEGVVLESSNTLDLTQIPFEKAPTRAPAIYLADYLTGLRCVDLGWLDPEFDNCEGYIVYRDGEEYTVVQGFDRQGYLDFAIEPNTTYDYAVVAYNPLGNSPVSNTVTVTTTTTPEAKK